MKKILLSILTLAILSSNQLMADEISGGPRINMETGILDLPCVAINAPGNINHGKYFDVRLKQTDNTFKFVSAEEEDSQVCSHANSFSLLLDNNSSDNIGNSIKSESNKEKELLINQYVADISASSNELSKKYDLTYSYSDITNQAIQLLLPILNEHLYDFFTTSELSLFGKADNRLDPLDFNGTIHAYTNKCTARIPIFKKCIAHTGASADVSTLKGLASTQINTIEVTDFTTSGDNFGGNGSISLSSKALYGKATTSAWVGKLKLSVSGSLAIVGLQPHGKFAISLALVRDPDTNKLIPQLQTLELTSLETPFNSIHLSLNGIGKIFAPVINTVSNISYRLVRPFFNVGGAIGKAMKSTVNNSISTAKDAINNSLRDQWIKEMSKGQVVLLNGNHGPTEVLSITAPGMPNQ